MTKSMTMSPGAADAVRVLVVDDDLEVRMIASRFLTGNGAVVTTVADGREAVAAVEREVFDVVLTDLWMPEMNGLETVEEIRKHDKHVSIVAMSGMGTPATEAACKRLGAVWFLAKPFKAAEVAAVIEAAANSSRNQREVKSPKGIERGDILLLEDHEGVRAAIAARLRMDGFHVTATDTVAEAIKAWQLRSYDLGLFDIHLPDGTGDDAARSIVARDPDANILFMTGEATKSEVAAAVHFSAGGCLRKPIDLNNLTRTIEALIGFAQISRRRSAQVEAYQSLPLIAKMKWRTGRKIRRASRTGELKRGAMLMGFAVLVSIGIFSILDSAERFYLDGGLNPGARRTLTLSEMYDKIAGYLERDERRELERER